MNFFFFPVEHSVTASRHSTCQWWTCQLDWEGGEDRAVRWRWFRSFSLNARRRTILQAFQRTRDVHDAIDSTNFTLKNMFVWWTGNVFQQLIDQGEILSACMNGLTNKAANRRELVLIGMEAILMLLFGIVLVSCRQGRKRRRDKLIQFFVIIIIDVLVNFSVRLTNW